MAEGPTESADSTEVGPAEGDGVTPERPGAGRHRAGGEQPRGRRLFRRDTPLAEPRPSESQTTESQATGSQATEVESVDVQRSEAHPAEPVLEDAAPSADTEAAASPTTTPPATGPNPPAGRFARLRRRGAADGAAPAGKASSGKTPAGKAKRKAPWWELPILVILAILIAIGLKTFIVQPFYIPSESMEHTLHGCTGCEGDRILVNKTIYWFRDPEPGDIVVFDAPPGWDDEPKSTPPSNPVLRAVRGFGQLIGFVPPDGEVLVKRVIASGGQTVKGDTAGHVMVSDDGVHFRTLVEPYVFDDAGETQPAFGPVKVPAGRLWVMGDHRTRSADSRYHCTAGAAQSTADDLHCDATASTVPYGDVIGKAVVIAWPPSRWNTLGTPATFDSAAGWAGSGLVPALAVLPVVPLGLRRRRRLRRR